MAQPLTGMRIAILATDMVEEVELVEARQALEDAGAETDLIAPKDGEIIAANHFNKGEAYPVDATLDEVEATDYDAVYLPGGALNADMLRIEPRAIAFVQHMDEAGNPIGVICHGTWLLVSAGLVEDRTLTSFQTIADDIINAGGEWVDKPVVQDENWISSRKSDDLPEFTTALVEHFARIFRANELLV